MKKSSLILILGIFALCTSCVKEVAFDNQLIEPKLVIQGLIEVDSTFAVYLEHTHTFNEPNTYAGITSGATITVVNLTTGVIYTTSIPADSNRYELPFNVTPNTGYQITVTHPDYPTVTATTYTTQAIPLISVDTGSFNMEGIPKIYGLMKWQDPPGNQFYMVCVYSEGVDSASNSQFSNSVFGSDDPIVSEGFSLNPDGDHNSSTYFVFSDEQFANSMKTFRTYFDKIYVDESIGGNSSSIRFTLISMNQDTYLYYKSMLIQQDSDPTFSEPVKIYSNVTNGYGIFGSVSGSKIIL